MTKTVFCIIFLFLLQVTAFPQATGRIDTIRVKEIVSDFTRLAYTKADKDSLIGLMGFPLYIHEGKAKRIFNSAADLRKELQKKYKNEKFSPVEYYIDSISGPAFCRLPELKTKTCICLTAHLVLPHTGQDPKGMILATTFYLERKPPYKVIGTSNQYN
ncbi:MAG: hypothetical protein U0X40_01550 [Ferruginibacter sp.]